MIDTVLAVWWGCFKTGLLAFGGGNSAIPMLQAEAVPRWVSEKEFAELVAVNFAFPGVSILKIGGMLGLRAAGLPGMAVAIVGLAMPGLLLTMGAYSVLSAHRDSALVDRAMTAMQYAAVALLAGTTLSLFRTAGDGRLDPRGGALVLVLLAASVWFQLPPVVVVLAGAVLGMLLL